MDEEQRSWLVGALLRLEDPLKLWCPHEPTVKQRQFIDLDVSDALYGGAAGGGKSDALLMVALKSVSISNHACLILRRTYPELSQPGAIMDRSHQWLQDTPAIWSDRDKTWLFPSGARIVFGYLETEKDKYRYLSSEWQTICVDELTGFTETSISFLKTRLRRLAEMRVPTIFRGATNPGGVGHSWVKARYIDPQTRQGTSFVSASLYDNPHIDQSDYESKFFALDEITRRQLLHGEWVQDAGGLVYKFAAARNTVPGLPELPVGEEWTHTIGVDFGASSEKPTTAFAVWASNKFSKACFLVEATKHAGMIPTTIAERLNKLRRKYMTNRIVGDQGALGRGYIEELRMRHKIPIEPAQKQNKLGFIRLLNGDLEAQRAMVVCGKETDHWVDEAQNLLLDDTGEKESSNYANHTLDAALYGWREAVHFMYKEPVAKPKVGSEEHYHQVERDQIQREWKRVERARRHPLHRGIMR